MKVAYFDCQFGAAGDMLLASLLGAGLLFDNWQRELSKVALPEGSFRVELIDVIRGTVACKKLEVHIPASAPIEESATGESTFNEHHHAHEHHHFQEHSRAHHADSQDSGHSHNHDLENSPDHGHSHNNYHHGGTRHLSDVVQIIEDSRINPAAKALAARVFERLAVAEGKVHGKSKDEVHFHEVGAVDAIIDIVGFAIGYTMLGIEQSYVSAVPIGSGFIKSAHGTLPVPGPAVLYLLNEAGAATQSVPQPPFECLTPTGAAILAEVAVRWGTPPSFEKITSVGYGAGTRDPAGWPNACRSVLGEARAEGSPRFTREPVAIVEANIDDLSPQALAYAVDRLLAAGALDVVVLPAVMKKGRSGHLIQVIGKVADRIQIEELLLAQTTSIGCRSHIAERAVADRQWQEVKMEGGEIVRVKVAKDLSGTIINAQPEFDDCARYATARGVPLKEVLAEAMARYRQQATS
jgi:uncharacterized protein (TIGR00299 family) protein